ncbi:hypothetical protein ANS017_05400 [Paraclostridium bifermentans]|uniref:hypothetical protein n=1 Tax=Paraclostridium bifermentans TaxID=1490 RepID=UPI001F3818C8|nr:hypothetical protein [Paraclostridium bifermentans]MCE9674714.1 hypothetical protein [Paraclostridium bifermentans]GKZ03761.1 hypothetical protein ANS014_21950 [Paraclostridium bifermentans]GKZ07635.1 hypothetical protein ANS015_25180 [Paraclostridium bifermentans]GKZ09156.1 hypothetical protein ANS017_05400 [Paraclostridium bifermentans]
MNKNSLKIFRSLLYAIYIFSIGYFLFNKDYGKVSISFLCLIILYILTKAYIKNFYVIDTPLYVVGNLFVLFSFLIGSCYGMYDIFKPYDSFLHFWSGFISFKIGWNILKYYNTTTLTDKILFFIVIFFFSLGVSGLCEIVEYSLDKFFNMTTQAGGLKDTMQDMIYAMTGAFLMVIYYIRKK